MSQQKETELVAELQRVRDAGGEFLNALYVYRSVQRALPDAPHGEDVREAVLAIMEPGLSPLLSINGIRDSLLQVFRRAFESLARVDGLTSTDLGLSLIQTLGLVHLLDGVKDNKLSAQKDFALYEETLDGRCGGPETRPTLQRRLEDCRKLREIFATPRWFLNGLLSQLSGLTKAPVILADLLELLTRGLLSEDDGSAPVFLPHDRYKLLRALPLVLYLYHFVSKRVVVTEPISAKLMESAFKLLKRFPVVPGIGDYAVVTYAPIMGIIFAPGGPYAKDMKRHEVMSLDDLDRKLLEHLEREYSLMTHHIQVRDVHDGMCDKLTRFVKASRNWQEAGECMPLHMCQEAVDLSYCILNHLSSWRCRIHELLAWRKSAPTLYESFQAQDDISDFSRFPSRVIRIFHDSDVPLVLETLVCIHGLAKLFKKTKDGIVPTVKTWLNHVVQLFLEQTSPKRRSGSDVDPLRVFQSIENFKLHILEGRHACAEMTPLDANAGRGRLFNAHHPESLLTLRKATEELFFLCNHHHHKSKISSYICGHPVSVAPSLLRATKDLLHQLYMMQEVLKADAHLDKIMDFSDLSMREREIEVTGSVELNGANAVALQLAHGAIKSSYGGSLEPVFIALQLFDGAADKLLDVYKSQLIFLELRQTAMEGLELLLDEICKQAVIQAKIHACVVSLDIPPSCWVEEIDGIPSRMTNNFDCVFQKETLSLAGYDVDIRTALVDRLNVLLKAAYQKLFLGLEASQDPRHIATTQTRIEIMKEGHRWLRAQLPLLPWDKCVEEKGRTSRFAEIMRECVVQKLLRDFSFDARSQKFKPFHQAAYSFKISARSSTPKINFDVRAGLKDGGTFSIHDVAVIHEIMTQTERETLIADVQRFIVEELKEFFDKQLKTLYAFVPSELENLRISELAATKDLSAAECLNFVLDKFGAAVSESTEWTEPLRALERIGNGVVFLRMLQICVLQNRLFRSVQLCRTIQTRSHPRLETVHHDFSSFDTVDSGNPFEMAIRKKKPHSPRRAPSPPMACLILHDCIQTMSIVVEESERRTGQRPLDIRNSLSVVLLLKCYTETYAKLINASYGDGVLWAANLVRQLSKQGQNFEQMDWIHEILRLAQLENILEPFQDPTDVQSFMHHAENATSRWRQISQFRLVTDNNHVDGGRSHHMPMVEDSPLRGLFGGVTHAMNSARRRSGYSLSGWTGPLRASIIKNKAFSSVPQNARTNLASSSADPFHTGHSARFFFGQEGIQESPSTWKSGLEETAIYHHYHRHGHSG